MIIHLNVPAIPVAQPRQRHRVGTSAGGKSFVMNYTPTKSPVNDYKATVRMTAQARYTGTPLEGPLKCRMVFVMPRPSSLVWKKKPMPPLPHTGKPDCDNLAKSTLDALSGLLWKDDAQICSLKVEKLIASGTEQPCARIYVETIEDLELGYDTDRPELARTF